MSYPPPPGAKPGSLPPRPPPSQVSGFKPAFTTTTPHTASPGVTASPYGAPSSYSGAASHVGATPARYGSPYQSYAPQGQSQMSAAGYQYPTAAGYQASQAYYGAQPTDASTYAAAPQIRNPFPAPVAASVPVAGQAVRTDENDPELAAQIAQWQSAYVKDPRDSTAPVPARPGPGGANIGAAYPTPAATAPDPNATSTEKKKTVVRAGGGQKWTDDTLLEWDPTHLRLFVGNLAGETTDESLYKAFSRWKSLQKARVIRDKVTSKSKGYGFVSFSDPDEFFQAAKEMNGKYIQSHPVRVSKATTEIKAVNVKDKHGGGKWNKNKNKHRSGGGSGAGRGGSDGAYEANLGAHGGGVTKPGQKTKGGLKLLG